MVLRHIVIRTRGQGLYEFTREAQSFIGEQAVDEGLFTVFIRHTSCSLLIQENADPSVQRDMCAFFARLAPPSSDPSMHWIEHRQEGPDDMPAHIKAALTQTSVGIPFSGRRLLLGTWQGLYLFEYRDRPHVRELVFHVSG
ncbi:MULTISPECIES: secondary thiamine-phosphate synthase enzyme YjbQ [Alphaproteobacteria]|uniref:Secondary thiamine-phosphate synthase enzyme n=2 Tax=Alphaproteobacteria TaxID=28211 RepID=A0A512HEH5_9HYPH|nr:MULTISPECIES: secondary thiamine-phosphate synthase enzyme YjbQ [Alphaproteobacteria]GEO83861.1 hypothetical protein RNA01_07930 [Ciceribacter naphthalenivorans]GLR21261.1 hypothetical protein GCM10007920_10470 [Ciceribacter naphthalenivorans]GLT04117.1 hypothetical protein GCM10007926_10470 [Sphingomonas psychrolutea]